MQASTACVDDQCARVSGDRERNDARVGSAGVCAQAYHARNIPTQLDADDVPQSDVFLAELHMQVDLALQSDGFSKSLQSSSMSDKH